MYPAKLGFKMPPEWCKHAGTFMEWPVKEAIWPEPFEEILPAYANIVKKIAEFEPVMLIVRPELVKQASDYCGSFAKIIEIEHNDSWMRDNGPTMLINSKEELMGVNWIFNAWGGKYDCKQDNLVAEKLLDHLGVPCCNAPFVMEGGSIHVDGEGTLLSTEECLLNKSRNPQMTKEKIEEQLKFFVSVEKFIWLKRGWSGDDTDGHVDNVACFAKPGVIITQVCRDPADPNYEITQENLKILKEATDAKGKPFEIYEIEQPKATYYEDTRLTLSYLNFYFVNDGIILPIFGKGYEETDKRAREMLQGIFPDRRISTVEGLVIARGGGNVHCLTQQMPAGVPATL